MGAIWKRTDYWPPPSPAVLSIERLSEVLPCIEEKGGPAEVMLVSFPALARSSHHTP